MAGVLRLAVVWAMTAPDPRPFMLVGTILTILAIAITWRLTIGY